MVLASTKLLINSVLSSSQLGETDSGAEHKIFDDASPRNLQLPVGILRLSKDGNEKQEPQLAYLDDSALVGLSTLLLRRLSITSGSLVILLSYILAVISPLVESCSVDANLKLLGPQEKQTIELKYNITGSN